MRGLGPTVPALLLPLQSGTFVRAWTRASQEIRYPAGFASRYHPRIVERIRLATWPNLSESLKRWAVRYSLDGAMATETLYARLEDSRIAYQVTGESERDSVLRLVAPVRSGPAP